MLIELFAVAAMAQPGAASASPSVIVNPEWRVRPSPSWPREAGAAGIVSGEVVLNCAAGAEGRVSDCRVESESPRGYDFGREALAASSRARLADADPAPDTRVTYTIRFRLPT